MSEERCGEALAQASVCETPEWINRAWRSMPRDGRFHKVVCSRSGGVWSFTIDGKQIEKPAEAGLQDES